MTTTKERILLKPPVAAALEVLGNIPQDCTWEDVLYHLEVRQKIEEGLRAIEEGRVTDHEEVFAKLLEGEDDDEESEE